MICLPSERRPAQRERDLDLDLLMLRTGDRETLRSLTGESLQHKIHSKQSHTTLRDKPQVESEQQMQAAL